MTFTSLATTLKNKVTSIRIQTVLIGLGLLLIMLAVFQAGVFVGFHKALFGREWGDRYTKNFDPRARDGFAQIPLSDQFASGHGAIGKIISIVNQSIIIDGPDHLEKTITLFPETTIRKFRQTASAHDLVPGTFIIVIGEPDTSGTINAKLIRILPPPPFTETAPVTTTQPTN